MAWKVTFWVWIHSYKLSVKWGQAIQPGDATCFSTTYGWQIQFSTAELLSCVQLTLWPHVYCGMPGFSDELVEVKEAESAGPFGRYGITSSTSLLISSFHLSDSVSILSFSFHTRHSRRMYCMSRLLPVWLRLIKEETMEDEVRGHFQGCGQPRGSGGSRGNKRDLKIFKGRPGDLVVKTVHFTREVRTFWSGGKITMPWKVAKKKKKKFQHLIPELVNKEHVWLIGRVDSKEIYNWSSSPFLVQRSQTSWISPEESTLKGSLIYGKHLRIGAGWQRKPTKVVETFIPNSLTSR